ncbi:profilin-1-like [Seriola lalandi dorsalis]|uniref:Profilin n=1 Tax=Seriola lalandi dorsalis TaxID=1841481 RepID=A0A3B4WTS8_SERLL|nr:profilin-1-like [Seriola lalandi dorsalis]
MSWDSYIDNLKTPDSNGVVAVAEAAICGMLSGSESVWASTPALANISVEEIKRLAGKRSDFGQSGPLIGGVKCRMIRDNMDNDGMFSLDLKTAADASGNAFSVCVGKSKSALVIAKGTKEANGGQLASKVFGIVNYLRGVNM